MARDHIKLPSFSQLDRLAEYEEWRDWKKTRRQTGRQGKGRGHHAPGLVPLDQLITDEGVKLPEEL